MGKLSRRFDTVALIIFFALAILLEYVEAFSLIEDETLSYRQILRNYVADDALTSPTKDVVLVYTDEEFYEQYNKFPLTRVDLSTIVDNLKRMGAKVIGIDMLLDFNSAYGEDGSLAVALKEAGNVLLVSQASFVNEQYDHLNRAIDRFSSVATSGYSNISSNSAISETMVRLRIYPEIAEQEGDGWPFSVQAVAMFLGEDPVLEDGVLTFGDKISLQLDQFSDLYIDYPKLPGDRGGGTQKLHDVIGVSALDILFAGNEEELEELSFLFEGKIVLIGEVAEVAHDEFETPVGNIFGVEIIANSIATILRNGPLRSASFGAELAIALIMALVMYLTTMFQNPVPRMAIALGGFFSHMVFVTLLYVHVGMVFSLSYVLIAGFLTFLAINLRFYMDERGQKALIRDAFGQYLSPKVVSDLVQDPGKLSLGGEEREMTAYFSDIARFSSFSETLSPSQLVALLNEYLTEMCNIIMNYEGTVDKFEGDAIIAFWGAPTNHPDHAKLACFASIDMNHAIATMREDWARRSRPELYVRMGLNTGQMLVGNMGSAQRMDYTMMGDAVNLAARLEGANKAYGTDIMISEHTYRQVENAVDVRELDTIRVVGKSEAVTVYQLLNRIDQTTGSMADVVDLFNQGLAHYKLREFREAINRFEQALGIHDYDKPSTTYLNRCRIYLERPPADDWDGVFTLDEKG